jgi:hypothetical protein
MGAEHVRVLETFFDKAITAIELFTRRGYRIVKG